MRSSHPSFGGASGMKSQSAPDASADTKARYLKKQTNRKQLQKHDMFENLLLWVILVLLWLHDSVKLTHSDDP